MHSHRSVYRPSNLKVFLEELKTFPKKSLSQNFLIDGNILDKIIQTADIQPGESVLEIGPGPGALTERLVEKGAKVIAVEKDSIFAHALKRLPIEVHEADILTFDFDADIQAKTKVLSNLPYHLTTPILSLLLPRHDLFSTLTVMVQAEVAKRMVAKPKTADYSSLTLFLQFYAETKLVFKVSRHCFYPEPKVDSACVHLTLKGPASSSPHFFTLTRTAFSHRRKMLRSSLKSLYPEIESLLASLHINPKARPEELSLQDFIHLASLLERS